MQQVLEQQDAFVLGVDVPALLHLYKARLALACHNYKAAKKEVGHAATDAARMVCILATSSLLLLTC